MLLRLASIFLNIAPRHQDQGQAVVAVLLVEPDEVGRQFFAGPAVRVGEDQEHPPAPIILQCHRAAVEVGEAK